MAANSKNANNRSNNRTNNRNYKNNQKSSTSKNVRNNRKSNNNVEVENEGAIKEIALWVALLASVILLLCVFNLCGPLSNVLGALLFGLFGFVAYLFPFLLFFSVGFYFMNINNKRVIHRIIGSWLLYLIFAALLQLFKSEQAENVFQCYVQGYSTKSGGGFLGGCLSMGLSAIAGEFAASIILILFALMLIVFITGKFLASMAMDKSATKYNEFVEVQRENRRIYEEERANEPKQEKPRRKWFTYTFQNEEKTASASDIVVKDNNLSAEDILKSKQEDESVEIFEPEVINSNLNENIEIKADEDIDNTSDNIKDDNADMFDNMKIHRSTDNNEVPIYQKEINEKFGEDNSRLSDESLQKLIMRAVGDDENEFKEEISINDDVEFDDIQESITKELKDEIVRITEEENEKYSKNTYEELNEIESVKELFGEVSDVVTDNADDVTCDVLDNPDIIEDIENVQTDINSNTNMDIQPNMQATPVQNTVVENAQSTTVEQKVAENVSDITSVEKTVVENSSDVNIEMPPEPIPYVFPPIDLLSKPDKSSQGMSDKDLKATALKLQECLKSFKVDVTMTDIICGPTVTRYELQPALGTRVKKITELENDIKLNLAAADIRIEAPIPGKSAVGIEVPNTDNVMISLREMLETKEFQLHKSNVAFSVGKDISGRSIVTDIARMPHLLIAGSTGSGKSVCINTIVMSIIYKADPNDVKLIMIDPKVVELSVYNGIPHLCIPVVTDPKKAAAALNWAVAEMNDRYSKFAELGVRDMKGFNSKIEKMKENPNMYRKMPQIVIIVDELADLMMVASHDVETAICRLAQMARAAGLHLIIATQRPSVDVITGLIKANVPSRIAFAVSSAVDSRTILDGAGAEKLLGKGDMLFFPQGLPKPIRVQGAFVSDSEVAKVTDFIKAQYDAPVYDAAITDKIANTELSQGKGSGSSVEVVEDDSNGRDDIFEEAGRFIIEKQKASIGTLQRVFKIGFNRGARIMDQLCEAGVVSEEDGKKPRNILMTLEEFEQMISEGR